MEAHLQYIATTTINSEVPDYTERQVKQDTTLLTRTTEPELETPGLEPWGVQFSWVCQHKAKTLNPHLG